MKLNDLSQRAILAVALLAGGLASSDARAEQTPISWSAVQTISGDSDVVNSNPIYALMTNPTTSTTVNGVTFSNSPLPAAYTPYGFDGIVGPNPATGAFGGLSANYQTVLSYAGTASSGNAAIGFTGLTSGQLYEIEIFVDNSSAGPSGSEYLDTTVSDSNSSGGSGVGSNGGTLDASGTLTYNTNPMGSAGGLGQYVTGTFIAGSTGIENVELISTGTVLLNAVVLSELNAVPEPSSIVMVGIGCVVGLGTYVRRRRTLSN